MSNHIGKTWCHQVKEAKKKQDAFTAQTTLMASFFKKREPIHSTVTPPTPVVPPTPRPEEHASKPSTSATSLLKLRDIASHLPDTILLAIPSDGIAALTGNPEDIVSNILLEDPDRDPYEWLDKILNGICGEYVKQRGLLPFAVWRGPMGLPGLCTMLEYFIKNNLASEVLLETCINALIEEAKQWYITQISLM